MERLPLSLDELAEHWTVLEDEKNLIARKRGQGPVLRAKIRRVELQIAYRCRDDLLRL